VTTTLPEQTTLAPSPTTPWTADQPLHPPAYFAWKPWLGWLCALVLMLPGVPMILAIMLLVRLTSRGPALFRQVRVGKGGRCFTMFKIRTMSIDAEQRTGPVWSTGRDPRITPLGRILRKLHLDELPQLFNVLRGEMSLIGPRPERPEIAARLAECIPGYYRRLAVLPGITGLAQINLPPDTDLESVRLKLVLDLEYIHDAGVLLDLRMFACSLLRLFGLSGELAMNLLRLKREPRVPPLWRCELEPELPWAGAVEAPGESREPVSHALPTEGLHHEPIANGFEPAVGAVSQ
jgi:lipopolysaccharide/colanic/teichoic acid biosynthesis glycosyltransferase